MGILGLPVQVLGLRRLPRYPCVRLQEFPQLLTPRSREVPPLVEFNAAVVVEPMNEILAATSRLLLEELPASLSPSAPEAPDPIAPGELQAALKGSTSHPGRCHRAGTDGMGTGIGVQEGLGGSCVSLPYCSLPSVHPMGSLLLCPQQLGDITLCAHPCHPQARCSPRRRR